MTVRSIEPEQHTAAKVAAVQTTKNIVASERLFRLSIVIGLMTVAGEIILLVALYVVLKPVNRNAALVAAFWRLAKCAIFAVIALNDFVALSLLSGSEYLRAFDTKQLQALARMFISVRHAGGLIGGMFLGLGSTAFACLWLKSRYIPRGLAMWGWDRQSDISTGCRCSSSKLLSVCG